MDKSFDPEFVMSILDYPIQDTPIAVIDFETTGLNPGVDRVIEISVVAINSGSVPELVFDTLVNPGRPVAATFVHGITDRDVKDAPKFEDISSALIAALEGRVVYAYNAAFDISFLDFELRKLGIRHTPPYLCLMYLQPLLGIGKRCRLDQACLRQGVSYRPTHHAADDALASGQLLSKYLDVIEQKEIRTYYELSRIRPYKFMESFRNHPFPPLSSLSTSRPAVLPRQSKELKSRSGKSLIPPDPAARAMTDYWELLQTVIEDLEISPEEHYRMERLREKLTVCQIRSVHAKAFATMLSKFNQDQRIDDREANLLKRLSQCLQDLGWSPGS